MKIKRARLIYSKLQTENRIFPVLSDSNSKYQFIKEYTCFLPDHLAMNRKTNFQKKNGEHNEQYYKWQFLYSIEKEIVLCVWEIRGLYNMKLPQEPKEAEKYRKTYNLNISQIKDLRQKAISLLEKLDITENAKQTLHKEISKSDTSIKGYKFIRDVHTQQIIEFKTLSFSASPKEIFPKEDLNILYSFLSFQSHPSFLGILQFGQMCNSDEYKKRALTILNSICKFQQIMVRDFCYAFPKAKEVLDKMPKEQTKYLIQNEI